ncbi:DNA polymerase IV [candidate division WOR-3 bacterium]|nr:DNA polymerase IV [candidate division WOR-3 bacterium]
MILYADLDAFFASVEQALNPALRGKPVVVAGDPRERRGVVSAASYAARKFGVHSAQGVWKAKEICPHCVFVQPHMRVYEAFSDIFYSILGEYSDKMEGVSVDEAYIELPSSSESDKSPEHIGREIKNKIRKSLQINATIGISISKTVAKIAAEQVKPDGLIVIPPGGEEKYVFPLPISKFPGIGKRSEEEFNKMNIFTIGDLLTYPRREILSSFGLNGIKWITSIYYSQINKNQPQKSISKSKTLSKDTRNLDILYSLLYYLTQKVVLKLQKATIYTTKISVTVRAADFSERKGYRKISPTNLASDIYPIAKEIFKQIPKRWVRLISVCACELTKMPSLFQDYRKISLEKKILEIRNRYGFDSIIPLINLNQGH